MYVPDICFRFQLAGYPVVFAIRFWFLTSRNVELHRMSQMDILLSITTFARKCNKILLAPISKSFISTDCQSILKQVCLCITVCNNNNNNNNNSNNTSQIIDIAHCSNTQVMQLYAHHHAEHWSTITLSGSGFGFVGGIIAETLQGRGQLSHWRHIRCKYLQRI